MLVSKFYCILFVGRAGGVRLQPAVSGDWHKTRAGASLRSVATSTQGLGIRLGQVSIVVTDTRR